jgi:hypothetical protein
MRHVCIEEERRQQEFAMRAAAMFSDNPKLSVFTDGDIERGQFLALRWGLGNDCVLVLKLDDVYVPTNYGNIIRQSSTAQDS